MHIRSGRRRLYEVSRLARWSAARRARHQVDAVFIWIPKTAGTSVNAALNFPKLKTRRAVKYHFGQRGHVTFGHMNYAGLWEAGYISHRFHRAAFKFAFVRNPYARAVSLYTYFQKIGKLCAGASFLQFCRTLESESRRPVGLYNAWGWSQANPQTAWLDNLDIDYLGRMEHLTEDLRDIQGRLGAKKRTPTWLNRSNVGFLADFYCRESRDLIRRVYDADFRKLGYSDRLGFDPGRS